jgi:hypothetical protein
MLDAGIGGALHGGEGRAGTSVSDGPETGAGATPSGFVVARLGA